MTTDAAPIESPDGYCIEMFEGSVWLTADGMITHDYDKRGIWPTLAEAEAALSKAQP